MEELKAAFSGTGEGKDEELWEDIMKEVDTDKDGQISLEEFQNSMKSFFKKSLQDKMKEGMKTKLLGMLTQKGLGETK